MRILLVFIVFIIPGILFSKDVVFDVDGAMFIHNSKSNRWEMYYSFPDTLLSYTYENGNYKGALYIKVSINSTIGDPIEKEWVVNYASPYPIIHNNMDLTGQKDFIVPFGQYTVEIFVMDVNDASTKASSTVDIFSQEFAKGKLAISDIELAVNIEKEEEATQKWNNAFLKNGLYSVPNPTLEYISENPVLNYYCEIYKPNKKLDSLCVRTILIDARRNERKSVADTIITKKMKNIFYKTIKADSLPSGLYYFGAKVRSLQGNYIDTAAYFKKIFLINPNIPPETNALFTENASFEKSEFVTMGAEQLEIEFAMFSKIAHPYEIQTYNVLETDDARRRALYSYWRKRDPDSSTVINEEREIFRRRVKFANTYFSYGSKENGWSTDRGGIMLEFGEPTQRDTHIRQQENNAYEEWFYSEIQGGIHFYFVDLLGFGDFILVHSDAIGFPRNESWFRDHVNKSSTNTDLYEDD